MLDDSVAPPSIVELSASRAVLSWRTLRRSFFYPTEGVTEAVDSEKWLSLEGGIVRSNTYHDHKKEASENASRGASLLEVDHVELQTCDCTCLQCLLEEQSVHTKDGPFTTRCSCTSCVPVRGEIVTCWRQVYEGPESRCEVKLEPENTLHHFRLLIRTRPATPEKRVFQRAKARSGLQGKYDAPRTDGEGQGKTLQRQQTGDDETTNHANGNGKASASVEVVPSRGSPRGRHVTPRGMSAPQKCPKARWFVSASVYIASCPPVITLYGIDRALVLTWPAVARFSGSERISYLVEQWSRPAGMPTTSGDLLASPSSLVKNNSKSTLLQLSSRPLPSDRKEAFLVGKRCWFVPVSLKAARRYWYRLRIVHKRGSSVGGPWVSHITSPGTLACTDVDAGGLALSFPPVIGRSVTVPLLEKRPNGKSGGGSGEIMEIAERSEESRAKRKGSESDVNGEQHREQELGSVTNQEPNDEVKEGRGDLGLQQETPAVSYTLEGLEAGSRWIVLYHGGSTDVIVKGLQANTLNTFRVSIDVDMTELRRRALGALASLELEQPPPPLATDHAIISTASNPPPLSRPTSGSSYPNERIIRPALRSQNAAACADLYSKTSSTSSDVLQQMKQEGFTVYDVTATIGGGFYPEPVAASPLLRQSSSDVSDKGVVDTAGRKAGSSNGGQDVVTTREGGPRRQYLELAIATAPLAPRYAAFVVDGVQKVKLWWAGARSSTEDFETQTAKASGSAMPAAGSPRPEATTEHAQPSTAKKTGPVGGSGALRLPRQSPSFVLGILDREIGDMRAVYSGPRRWADLGRSAVRGIPLAPGTAYLVRLSARTALAYPKGSINGAVITAPPAPILEPVITKGQGSAGATMVKVLWKTTIDTRFIPPEECLPPFSVAVEMAHSWEATSPSRGAGGVIRQTFRAASGRAALTATQKCGALQKSTARTRTGLTGSDSVAVLKDSSGGQCWTLDSSSWDKLGDAAGRFRVVWRGSSRDDEVFSPCMPPGMRFAFRIRVESPFGVAVSAVTVYQTAPIVPLPPKGLRAFLVTHESSRPKKKRQCVQLFWEPSDPGHGKNVVTSFTVEVRRPRGRMQQNSDGIRHPWRHVCSCSDMSCLDPSTLGVSRIFADYRVRAQGPGGVGPWSEPLRIDILTKTLRRSNSTRSKDGNGVSTGRGRIGSGNGNVAGTRDRDSLERTMGQRTQLNTNMSPPSSAVAALLLPAAESAAAATMAATEHLHKRAGGSKQLLWGTLVAPRSAHRRHHVAAAAKVKALTGNEICGWLHPALCGLDVAEDKIVSGPDGPEGDVGQSSREVEEVGSSRTVVGTVVSGGTAEVPPELELMLRKRVELSSGFIGSGRVSSAGLGSKKRWGDAVSGVEGLLRRNPGLPVVTWNAPLRVPCGNESGGGEDHKTTVKITPRLRELPISAPLRQSSGGNKPLRRRRSTGDSTRVPTRRREEDRKQEGLLPTIIRRHSYSHGRSSIEKAAHTRIRYSSPCLLRMEGPPQLRGHAESPHAQVRQKINECKPLQLPTVSMGNSGAGAGAGAGAEADPIGAAKAELTGSLKPKGANEESSDKEEVTGSVLPKGANEKSSHKDEEDGEDNKGEDENDEGMPTGANEESFEQDEEEGEDNEDEDGEDEDGEDEEDEEEENEEDEDKEEEDEDEDGEEEEEDDEKEEENEGEGDGRQ